MSESPSIVQITNFIVSPVTGELTEVPGVTPFCKEILNAFGIRSTYQLLARYMACVDPNASSRDIVKSFTEWLESITYPKNLIPICVKVVGEKLNVSFPGIYLSHEGEIAEQKMCQDILPSELHVVVVDVNTKLHSAEGKIEKISSRLKKLMADVSVNAEYARTDILDIYERFQYMEENINKMKNRIESCERTNATILDSAYFQKYNS